MSGFPDVLAKLLVVPGVVAFFALPPHRDLLSVRSTETHEPGPILFLLGGVPAFAARARVVEFVAEPFKENDASDDADNNNERHEFLHNFDHKRAFRNCVMQALYHI